MTVKYVSGLDKSQNQLQYACTETVAPAPDQVQMRAPAPNLFLTYNNILHVIVLKIYAYHCNVGSTNIS